MDLLEPYHCFWRGIQAIVLAVLAATVAGCVAAEPTPASASSQNAAELETVLEASRSMVTDSVLLARGSEVAGTIANPEFHLHTANGSLSIPARFIAAISFNAASGHLDSVLTVNRNRLSGFVNDDIQLETGPGQKLTLRKSEVRRLAFRHRETERLDARSGQFVCLDNGDFLSGAVILPPVVIQSPSGGHPVPADDIETLRFQHGPTPAAQLQLKNGREETVQIENDLLLIHLDVGPDFSLSHDRIKVIYARPRFVPLEVRQAFISPLGARSQAGPPPDLTAPPGMVWIPPGTFMMGSPSDENGRGSDEDPQTEVTISRGFWIGQREVTQGEYLVVMGNNPSQFQGDTNRPVERVSWYEARDYCARLNERSKKQGRLLTGFGYRLPTEAEWEYACRAGTSTRFSYGNDPNETDLATYAWFVGSSGLSSHPVGQLKPNPWNLFDIHGNVWEWCQDIWGGAYAGGQVVDYAGPADGWLRVARGGSWLYAADFSRSANRDNYGAENRCSDIGFRIVLAPAP